MLANGVNEPPESPWGLPIVVVPTKNNKYGFCVDFRKINLVTQKDVYPLSQINPSWAA